MQLSKEHCFKTLEFVVIVDQETNLQTR